jgi:hypothetical protein
MSDNDNSNGNERFSVKFLLALIGVLGVIVGGLVTYFGNKEIQDAQLERADQEADAVAMGTARVLQGIFRSAGDAYGASITACSFRIGKHLESSIPLADRKVIASRLSSDDWSVVARAFQGLQRESDQSLVTPDSDFGPDDVENLRKHREWMFEAQQALAGLADTPPIAPLEEQKPREDC